MAGSGSDQTASSASQRFFGVQWRMLYSHLEAVSVTAVIVALLVGVPLYLKQGLLRAGLLGLAALLVAVVGAVWLALRSARSIKVRLREASRFAAALARGDYRWRMNLGLVENSGQLDEIDQLGEELNVMADSLETAIAELRDLAERNRALAEESGRLAALEERTRLARDLHDTVNQQVFSLSMQAASARRRLETAGTDAGKLAAVAELLVDMEELARSAHRQMRDLILQLRPTTLEQQGLGPALEEYVRSFSETEGLSCECRVECTGRFGAAVEEAIFRITQEALNNVAKHSGAKQAGVRLALSEDKPGNERRVVVTITDNGKGFDPAGSVRPTALGLKGLKERATAVGGRLKIDSAPGRGTIVEASFPVGPGAGGIAGVVGRSIGAAGTDGATGER